MKDWLIFATVKLVKTTNVAESAEKRRYDDACGTAHALELIGDRWALLVVRELMFGGRRFNELRTGLPGISANVLAQRLEALEASGIVQRRKAPPPVSAQLYELSDWGYEAEAAIQALGRWAARSPAHNPALPLSAASLMLSLRTMFSAEKLGAARATIGFEMRSETFVARLGDGALAVSREDVANPDLLLAGDAVVLAGILYAGVPIADALSSGALRIEGSRAVAHWFTTLFPLPEKANAG